MNRITERQLESEVADRLKELGWQVYEDAAYGELRPDLVAVAANGKVYVFEIKASPRRSPSFTALAQTRAYTDAVRKSFDGKQVKSVLLTTSRVSPSLQEMSNELEIDLVEIDEDSELRGLDSWLATTA